MRKYILINCPSCSVETPEASVTSDHKFEMYGIKQRTIYGCCLSCGNHFEMEQFSKEGEWITTRFRLYMLAPQAWQQVAEIPVPAVVLDYVCENTEELIGSGK